jgi:hypothetical protein
VTPDDSAAPGPDEPHGAMALLRHTIAAACATLAEAAEIGRDIGSRRAQLQAVEIHLNEAARLVERGQLELTSAAAEILRSNLPEDACGIPWPVCRRCLGTGLTSSGGSSWCRSCGRSGGAAAARSAYLCPDRATVTVRGKAGDDARMCLSHAVGAARSVDGLTVVDATDEELQALLLHSDRPVRVDTSGRQHPLRLDGRGR